MADKKFLSTVELARILGISRIAVFKKIQKGQIKAVKAGRNYIIDIRDVGNILGTSLTTGDKQAVDRAVNMTMSDYGETIRLLGAE
jgi:excisionase family DNA binding protein